VCVITVESQGIAQMIVKRRMMVKEPRKQSLREV
jgi:hypothetical protein